MGLPNPPAPPTGEVRMRPRANGAGPVRASDMIEVPEGQEDIKSNYDPLEELLTLDPNRVIEEEVELPPFQRKWRVKAMSNDLNAQLLEQATYYKENPRTHEQIKELNNIEFARLVVAHCTVEPSLLDPRLYERHKVSRRRPDQLVAKLLLPGHIDRLSTTIMRISGFRDDLVVVAKNLSKEED